MKKSYFLVAITILAGLILGILLNFSTGPTALRTKFLGVGKKLGLVTESCSTSHTHDFIDSPVYSCQLQSEFLGKRIYFRQ